MRLPKILVCVLSAVLLASSSLAQAGRYPIEVHSLEYPRLALLAGLEGEVEVRCHIDSEGVVRKAEAVSGPRPLADHATENAMLWRFAPHGPDHRLTLTTLTYLFVIDGVSEIGNPKSTFVFKHPDHVVVTSGRPRTAPASTDKE
jgi:TonB family protein